VRHCEVAWGLNPPDYYRYALEAEDVPGLALEDLRGASARPELYPPVRTT
jgi:hypothetical protein